MKILVFVLLVAFLFSISIQGAEEDYYGHPYHNSQFWRYIKLCILYIFVFRRFGGRYGGGAPRMMITGKCFCVHLMNNHHFQIL